MTRKNEATAELQLTPQKQRDRTKPFLLGKKSGARNVVVSQLRLARIQQMQSDIAYTESELAKEWETMRNDLLRGGVVEKGPLRAWIKCSLRKNGTVSKRLIVR